MPKGSIPRIGTEPVPPGPQPQTVAQPERGFINPSVLGLAAGPMGLRRTKPEVAAQIKRLIQELHEGQAADQPIPVMDRPQPMQAPPAAQDVPVQTPEIPKELPRQPPPQAIEGQPPVAAAAPEEEKTKEEEEGKKVPDPGRIAPTPMQAMAESGAEARVYRGLQYDVEFMDSLFWRASPERRKIIESQRCGEMRWDSLLTNYEITQKVMVWKKPKEVFVEYRSMTTDDEYLVRRILFEKYLKTQPEYEVGSMITTCAAGTISIGDMVLPQVPPVHLSDQDRRKDVLEQRIKMVLRLPFILAMDIAINYAWFIMRVNRMLQQGDLGNG